MPTTHLLSMSQSEVDGTSATAEQQDQPTRGPENPGGGSGDRNPNQPSDVPKDPNSDSGSDRSNTPGLKNVPTRGPEDPGGGSGGDDQSAILSESRR